MWFRVDDGFLEHPKVLDAADRLSGKNSLGRIAAVWLEVGLYSARSLTDGFIPYRLIDRLHTDSKPREVLLALSRAGLGARERDGFRLHDWADYNPSASEVKSKRKRDRERKRVAMESKANPSGIQVESTGSPARSRARDPVPSRPVPKDPQDQEQRASARESHAVLVKLAHDVLTLSEAREAHPDYPNLGVITDDPGLQAELLKCLAGKHSIAYNAQEAVRALESAAFQRRRPA